MQPEMSQQAKSRRPNPSRNGLNQANSIQPEARLAKSTLIDEQTSRVDSTLLEGQTDLKWTKPYQLDLTRAKLVESTQSVSKRTNKPSQLVATRAEMNQFEEPNRPNAMTIRPNLV